MKITFELNGEQYLCDTDEGQSIAIEMDFGGAQPNHFGTQRAAKQTLELDGFVGDTRRGGSCNVDVIELVPHCNGTHTETVGHIVNDDVFVGRVAPSRLLATAVVTLESVSAQDALDCQEAYRPAFRDADRVLTAANLIEALERVDCPSGIEAMVIRTLPNEEAKKSRAYNREQEPAFFTVEAIEFLNRIGCEHLLVDVPSVDRMQDDGFLTNHHLYWNVAEGTHELGAESHRHKTITEMVFVPESLADGFYLCCLQVPAFFSDAAPSRPVLYRVEKV